MKHCLISLSEMKFLFNVEKCIGTIRELPFCDDSLVFVGNGNNNCKYVFYSTMPEPHMRPWLQIQYM